MREMPSSIKSCTPFLGLAVGSYLPGGYTARSCHEKRKQKQKVACLAHQLEPMPATVGEFRVQKQVNLTRAKQSILP